jgi:hypothetical protein
MTIGERVAYLGLQFTTFLAVVAALANAYFR